MEYLMIEDRATGSRDIVSLDEAVRRTMIDATEIEWAIEEFGVCDAMDHIITDTRDADEVIAA